ncbi:MAG: arylsulfotransferase family protein [Parachlamydiaceae bacterium]
MMYQTVSLYNVFVVIFFGGCVTLFFGWSVRHVFLGNYRLGAFGRAMVSVAAFPSLAKEVVLKITAGNVSCLVIEDRFPLLDGFKKSGKLQAGVLDDKGYLLLSSYDNVNKQSTVQLLRIHDQHIMKEWTPDIDVILARVKIKIRQSNARILHPLLLQDGGLAFSLDSLVKIGTTSSVEWVSNCTSSHSVEQDADGNIWICSRMKPSSFEGVLSHLDDAIAQISLDGNVLFKKSVAKILYENGYCGLLAGGFRGRPEEDPIHLNQVQPALTDSTYWKKGDLLLSMKHRSTIALYRPSTDKIIWLKTGPWMNQHCVEFVSDHEISVFGNNVISDAKGEVLMDGHNIVYRYDFANGLVSTPYDKGMVSLNVCTISSGRSKVLLNGDVFIEETNNGRLLRLAPDRARWEFVRRVDNNHLSMPGWSRYLTEEQVRHVFP